MSVLYGNAEPHVEDRIAYPRIIMCYRSSGWKRSYIIPAIDQQHDRQKLKIHKAHYRHKENRQRIVWLYVWHVSESDCI